MNYYNHVLLDKLLNHKMNEDEKKEFEQQVNDVLTDALKQKDGISKFTRLADLIGLKTYKLLETTFYEDNAEDNNNSLGENCEERLYYYFARGTSFKNIRHDLFNGHGKNYEQPKEANIDEYLTKVQNGEKEVIPVEFLPNTSEFITAIFDLAKDKKKKKELTEVIDYLNVVDLEEPAF